MKMPVQDGNKITDFDLGEVLGFKKGQKALGFDMIPSVVLCNPKYSHNLGAAVRACSNFNAKAVLFTGERMYDDMKGYKRVPREERMKGYNDIVIYNDDYPLDRFEKGVTPVAIERRQNSENLVDFIHPENAVYVFGPEDGSVHKSLLSLCHRFVVIPSNYCLNLSAAVNVVLYDRIMKEGGLI